ncbi:MAG: cytidylate kinase-like family protein [Planctomycetota bacterium]|jgi:cytidylate kinase
MAKLPLSDEMKEQPTTGDDLTNAGPYVTISRQFGCYGFSLGMLLLEVLNEPGSDAAVWQVYHKEILAQLATETDQAVEILNRQRRAKPSWLGDMFRSLSKDKAPSGFEVRNRITAIIRGLATDGQAIIIGQGGAGATHDIPNGLSVRLEAPDEWRTKQVAFREGLSETEAKLMIREREAERDHLRQLYEKRFPRKPPFHMLFDCSEFSLAQIAQQIVYAMRLKRLV